MLMLNSWMNSKALRFPVQYSLAMPDAASEGRRFPLVMLLHDLGESREQWLYGARLAHLAEKHRVCLLMPEGRRSCFQDMAHGPKWNTWLMEELIPWLQEMLCVSAAKSAVIGVGAGALGALACAREQTDESALKIALIDPDVLSALQWDSARWRRESEWLGAFEARQEMWRKERFALSRGVLVGYEAAVACCASAFGLDAWERCFMDDADLEQKLDAALALCARSVPEARGQCL